MVRKIKHICEDENLRVVSWSLLIAIINLISWTLSSSSSKLIRTIAIICNQFLSFVKCSAQKVFMTSKFLHKKMSRVIDWTKKDKRGHRKWNFTAATDYLLIKFVLNEWNTHCGEVKCSS